MDIQLVKSDSLDRETAVLFILTDYSAGGFARLFASRLSLGQEQLAVVGAVLPAGALAEDVVLCLQNSLRQEGLKRFTLFGIGQSSCAALLLAAQAAKSVRRLILLDAEFLQADTLLGRLVGAVDTVLPIGLPLRSIGSSIDPRPIIHRINCPTLVFLSRDCGPEVSRQGKLLAERIPNSWLQILAEPVFDSAGRLGEEFAGSLAQFVQVPTKRSQKSG